MSVTAREYMPEKVIRVAMSPDSDDLFMFYAIIEDKIDTNGYTFQFETAHTASLNSQTLESDSVDVVAISIHNYAYVADRYLMLPHGGSVGRQYGPLLITGQPSGLDELNGKRIAIPGPRTTANLILTMMIPEYEPVVIPVSPFEAMFDAIESGDVDAGLVIHEGRLLAERRGFHVIADIGEWWYDYRKLPLPLGGNVIKRSLGSDVIKAVSAILKTAIRYALDHEDEVIDYIIANDPRQTGELKQRELIRDYLRLYANEDTYDYGEEGRAAIQEILDVGYQKDIIPHSTFVQFAP